MKDKKLKKYLDPKHFEGKDFIDIKSMGFIPDEIKPEDYVFGGLTKIPDEIRKSDGQWLDIVIENEHQAKNGVESMNCTNYGKNNALEIIHKEKYGEEINISERADGIMSGTTKNGNSPHTTAENTRKNGALYESDLPFDNSINTWEKYYSPKPLPQELKDKAKLFLEKYDFLHGWVTPTKEKLIDALKRCPLGISVKAWKMRNGLYYKGQGEPDNHWCTLIGYEFGKYWYVRDSYDAWIKKLEWNYDFGFAKEYYLAKKKIMPQETPKATTPVDGYLQTDLAKIKISAGTELDSETMTNNWCPWNFERVTIKAEEFNISELINALFKKIFKK